jgi:glutamine synthetase
MGVYRHNGLLKASIMSATNAHRLGANEAPPAIISSFLGKQVSQLLDHIERADVADILAMTGKQGMKMDIPEIPELFIDNTDRNRTSPFAFTGNRFEFRAVGSEANCASAMIALNSAVAEALTDFKKRVDARIPQLEKQLEGTGHSATFHAIIEVLRQDIKTCRPIRFDGNGYSDEWVLEAQKRGLDVEKSCPKIFERYLDPESIQMFESLGVMTRKELEARNEVKWETYTKKIQIEARVLGDLSMNHIIPVATHYQTELLKNVENMAEVFSVDKAERLSARNIKLIEEIAERTTAIEKGVEELVNARKLANKISDEHQKAIAYHDRVEPKLDSIRYEIDKLELIVDDALWPLPKYRELLFIR